MDQNTEVMELNNNRAKRPSGFKTMAILGYLSEGLSLPSGLFVAVYEISEGQIFSAPFSLFYAILSVPVIVAIFMMAERKSHLALNFIRIYLWGIIPLGIISSIVQIAYAESGAEVAAQLFVLFFTIIVMILIALYWQQKSHSEYLESFNH